MSRFAYARAPVLARPFGDYLLYRLECGLRSTLVLGFVGLPTMGFELESYFRQGHYAEAAGFVLVFYALIGTTADLGAGADAAVAAAGGGGGAGDALTRDGRRPRRPGAGAVLRAGHRAPAAAGRVAARWRHLAGVLGGWLWAILRDMAVPGIVNTLIVSQLALVLLAALALALFPLTSRQFTGRLGRPFGRVLLVVLRSTPEYIVAYVLVQTLGPSMLPAVLALAIHNGGIVGYLMGRQADGVALRPDAPRGLDLYAYEVVPRLYGQFLAYALYRWEIVVRESALFGLLGVRTLGYHVDASIQELRLDVAVVLIVVTALSVDGHRRAVSGSLRRRLRIADLPVRQSAATAPVRPAPGLHGADDGGLG